MTGGDIAGLIAAAVFAVLVALLAVPILKLGRVLDELRVLIRDLNDETEPLLEEVTRTVATTNSQLAKVDVITDSVSDASASMSAMTSLVASTVGQPIIKTAAFSSGVRKAFSADAVRARREERRRARAAEEAQAPTQQAGEEQPSGPTSAEHSASTHGSSEATGSSASTENLADTAQSSDRDEPAGARRTGAWWEGTEWDDAPAHSAHAQQDPVGAADDAHTERAGGAPDRRVDVEQTDQADPMQTRPRTGRRRAGEGPGA